MIRAQVWIIAGVVIIVVILASTLALDYETSEYKVTFTGQGYESSGNWSVNISGILHYAHDGNVSFKLHRGEYRFFIFHNQTYSSSPVQKVIVANPHNSTLILENNTSILVTFSAVNVSISGTIGQVNVTMQGNQTVYGSYNRIALIQFVIIPIAVILAIIILIVAVFRRNRVQDP